VIDDARSHQHRRHRRLIGVVLAVLATALVVYATLGSGGAGTRFAVPSPGTVTGSLQPLSSADYQLWVTPSLSPGGTGPMLGNIAGVTIAEQEAYGGSSFGSFAAYAGAGSPVVSPGEAGVHAYVPEDVDPDYILFVASNVAAIRVGTLGLVGTQANSGLPPDEKLAAFRVPQTAQHATRLSSLYALPTVPLTLISSNGTPIATVRARPRPSLHTLQLRWALAMRAASLTTQTGGACAVTSSLRGLTDQAPFATTVITPLTPSTPGIFLSCLDDKYAYKGAKFNVAILLDAHRPGQALPRLWDAATLAGHPGIVEVAPPAQFPTNTDATSPLFARRVANTWLVVQARPGFARNPGLPQTIQVLNSLHISRITLPHQH
jgi:hypothetical protein